MGLFRKKEYIEVPAPEKEQDVAGEVAAQMQTQEILGGGQTPFAEYLYAHDLPKLDILEMFPVLKNKVLALTNLPDPRSVDHMIGHIDALETDYKLWTPKRLQRAAIYMEFDQLRTFTMAQLWRSTGKRERDRALLTTVTSYQDRPQQNRGRSILGRLKEAVV